MIKHSTTKIYMWTKDGTSLLLDQEYLDNSSLRQQGDESNEEFLSRLENETGLKLTLIFEEKITSHA